MNSAISVVGPKHITRIIQRLAIRQVAPDRYLYPLPGRTITDVQFGKGRIQQLTSPLLGNPPSPAPVNSVFSELIHPVEGAGPQYLGAP